ncbi:unnamed protein product, partial [Discosporangium mesarthrocarpum]
SWDDWLRHFTHLFSGIDFPHSWCGTRVTGRWDDDSGGNRLLATFLSNPKMKLYLPQK